ncbi:MAG TPA: MFS transporter, partial [Solirubrobacterales bacterium]
GGMFAAFLYLTIYIQGVLGYSPLDAGLRFLPLTLLSFFVAPISGKLSHRVPVRVLMGIGLAMVGVGLMLMRGVTVDSDWTTLLVGFLVAGAGIGLTNPGIAQAAIAVVEPARAGMASGINTTFRQVGIATGVAGLGAVFQSRIDSKFAALMPNAQHGLSEAVASGGSVAAGRVARPGIHHQVVVDAKIAFVGAFNDILLIAAVIAFVGAALGFLLVRDRDFLAVPGQEVAPPDEAAEPVAA